MNKNKISQPIGIFDSGMGGLTVAHAITKVLPSENIVYFGDTAYLPYGDKSADVICERALKIADFLAKKQCKLIIIACNSASAVAFDVLQTKYARDIPVINVIDPVVDHVANHCADKTAGLIGTHCTVNSNVYLKKLSKLNQSVQLKSLATPLLVPMIEQGKHDQTIITKYLTNNVLADIELLILGCTHYPLIKDVIENFYAGKVDVLDSPKIVAAAIKEYLVQNNLLNSLQVSNKHFYVSDLNESFASLAQQFFSTEIVLENCPI
ncbi:MAG: glutamate racemase [Gammaproteobacteria bacterium]|jgi:glutamate racemase